MGDGERPIEVDRSPRGLDRLSISIQIQQEHGPQVMQLARERVPLRRRGADALGLRHILVSQRANPERRVGPVGGDVSLSRTTPEPSPPASPAGTAAGVPSVSRCAAKLLAHAISGRADSGPIGREADDAPLR